jgi:hypothetical protein
VRWIKKSFDQVKNRHEKSIVYSPLCFVMLFMCTSSLQAQPDNEKNPAAIVYSDSAFRNAYSNCDTAHKIYVATPVFGFFTFTGGFGLGLGMF